MNTGSGGHWFDRRRRGTRIEPWDVNPGSWDALGSLQEGTPAQLPVPAKILEERGEATYNFGGISDPEGTTPILNPGS